MNEIARDAKGRLLPGHSGNPAGRPKGSLNKISRDILDALEQKAQDGDKSNLQQIIEALVAKAKKGDAKAIEILFERGFGKSKEFIELSRPEDVVISDWGDEVENDDNAGEGETTSS